MRRRSALENAMAQYAPGRWWLVAGGWWLVIACGFCGRYDQVLPLDRLKARSRPDDSLAAVVSRLLCSDCERPPSFVRLEGSKQFEVVLVGSPVSGQPIASG